MNFLRCALAVASVSLFACTATTIERRADSSDPTESTSGSAPSTPSAPSAASPTTSASDASADGSARDDDAGSVGSSSGGSSSGASGGGFCSPNAVCNGIRQCDDSCFGERCCLAQCACDGPASDPSSHLACDVTCGK